MLTLRTRHRIGQWPKITIQKNTVTLERFKVYRYGKIDKTETSVFCFTCSGFGNQTLSLLTILQLFYSPQDYERPCYTEAKYSITPVIEHRIEDKTKKIQIQEKTHIPAEFKQTNTIDSGIFISIRTKINCASTPRGSTRTQLHLMPKKEKAKLNLFKKQMFMVISKIYLRF